MASISETAEYQLKDVHFDNACSLIQKEDKGRKVFWALLFPLPFFSLFFQFQPKNWKTISFPLFFYFLSHFMSNQIGQGNE